MMMMGNMEPKIFSPFVRLMYFDDEIIIIINEKKKKTSNQLIFFIFHRQNIKMMENINTKHTENLEKAPPLYHHQNENEEKNPLIKK